MGKPASLKAIEASYLPMTETAYYTLLSLTQPRHGYGVMQHVEAITSGRLRIGAGTLYGSLARMERDGIIAVVSEVGRRKTYGITATGSQLLEIELGRLRELVGNGERAKEQRAWKEELA